VVLRTRTRHDREHTVSINQVVETMIEKPKNLLTHTGAVHSPGRYNKTLRTNAPTCTASLQALMRYHYITPTDADVTCRRCLAREAAKTQ